MSFSINVISTLMILLPPKRRHYLSQVIVTVCIDNAVLSGEQLLAKISDAGAKSQLFFVLLSNLL